MSELCFKKRKILILHSGISGCFLSFSLWFVLLPAYSFPIRVISFFYKHIMLLIRLYLALGMVADSFGNTRSAVAGNIASNGVGGGVYILKIGQIMEVM